MIKEKEPILPVPEIYFGIFFYLFACGELYKSSSKKKKVLKSHRTVLKTLKLVKCSNILLLILNLKFPFYPPTKTVHC
jgi:hypothetical protein